MKPEYGSAWKSPIYFFNPAYWARWDSEPRMQITTTTEQTITIDPDLAHSLQVTAATLLDLQMQAKALEQAIDAEKATLLALVQETGQKSFVSGEYRYTLVTPQGGRLSQQSLLSAGVSASQIAKAKELSSKPGNPYAKVSLASDADVIAAASQE